MPVKSDTKMTRKQRVYNHLLEAKRAAGKADLAWVDGTALCADNIGGPQGLRYVRFLRAEGYQISKRYHMGRYQYRLDRVKPVTAV